MTLKLQPSSTIYNVPTSTITDPHRRLLGQYWTPEPLADFLINLLDTSPNKNLLDPALGTGIFIAKYQEKLRSLGNRIDPDKIYGTELDPKIYNIFCQLGPGSQLKFPHVTNSDYLLTNYRQKFDLIVCNPPYTRHHLLNSTYKKDIRHQLEKQFNIPISSLSSQFIYFFLKSLSELAPTGRLVYLTPIELFEAGYARSIVRLITDQFRLRAVIRFDPKLKVFNGADNNLCITVLDGPNSEPRDTCQIIEIKDIAALRQLNSQSLTQILPTTDLYTVRQQDLSTFTSKNLFNISSPAAKTDYVPLSNFFRVTRGIATGHNDYFLFSDDKLRQTEIPKRYFQPVLTRTKSTRGLILKTEDIQQQKNPWLLYLQPETKLTDQKLQNYLKSGEEQGISNGYLVKTRRKWYHMERREPAPILFTYLGRTNPRFIWNKCRAQALSTFLLLYPTASFVNQNRVSSQRRLGSNNSSNSEWAINLKAFLATLNSPEFIQELRSHSRTYGSGGTKIEPRELERCLIPDFSKMEKEKKLQLARLFDELSASN